MKVSVIIPTYNEKNDLENCIESLGSQTFKDFEIIVVDDGSTDGTISILSSLDKSLPSFKYFEQAHMGAGSARNLGADKSSGRILVFVDADMTFENDFLDRLTAPIISGATKGTFSKDERVSNWDSVWARCWNINEGWESEKRHVKNYPERQAVFRAILSSEFRRVGGFTPGGYNDDWSLYQKLGYRADNAPGAVFYHRNPSTLKEVYKHAQWVGKRKYKFGVLGFLIALVRSSFPVSLVIGFLKSFLSHEPKFILFKIVFDIGTFVGICKYVFLKNGAK